jgi:hypothetical protein
MRRKILFFSEIKKKSNRFQTKPGIIESHLHIKKKLFLSKKKELKGFIFVHFIKDTNKIKDSIKEKPFQIKLNN